MRDRLSSRETFREGKKGRADLEASVDRAIRERAITERPSRVARKLSGSRRSERRKRERKEKKAGNNALLLATRVTH